MRKFLQKKSKKDFSLLDELTSGFLSHLNEKQEKHFEFQTSGEPYQLSKLQSIALEIFTIQVQNKGYKVSIKEHNTSRYNTFTIIVE